MGTELGMTLRGPHAGMDAADTIRAVEALLRLLTELEHSETKRKNRTRATRWTFTQLTLGSTRAALAPLRIPEDSSYEHVDRIMMQTVAGFSTAEAAPQIPPDWTPAAARLGRDVTRKLGASPEVGMHLALRTGGDTVREAVVTERAYRHLGQAVQTQHTSLGTRRGHLGGLSDARGKIRAVLWTEVGHERIPLYCLDAQREHLRRAWGRDRVEVTGWITENAHGQVVKLDVREIEVLNDTPTLSEDDLRGGFWPDMTGGLGALEYLAVIRGEE